MDARAQERNSAVRVPPLTALTVFALMAGLCAMAVFVVFVEITPQILVLVVGAAVIAGVLGMLIVPRVLYANTFTAMFVGALVALLSHLPFSILWALGGLFNPPFVFSEFAEVLAFVLSFGYIIGGIPQIIFGAVAGNICYRKGVPYQVSNTEGE